MPFVTSVHLKEIALASLHKTIHNDSTSNLNLCRPLYILTTIEDTLSLRSYSLYSISTVYSNIFRVRHQIHWQDFFYEAFSASYCETYHVHDHMSVTTRAFLCTFFSCQTVFIKLWICKYCRSDISLLVHCSHSTNVSPWARVCWFWLVQIFSIS